MIKGKKVFFRAIERQDLKFLQEWINDPEISRLVLGWCFPVSMAQQEEWFLQSLKDQNTQRFIVESYDEGVIGLTGLWQINWHDRNALTALKLGPQAARGRGYGTDAILTMMSYAFFNVGLHRLWGRILPYNIASYKAYVEKCGWKVEGVLRQAVFRDGRFYDEYRVGVLLEDVLDHPLFREYIPPAYQGVVEEKITVRSEHRIQF
jgi:RimJ/RimL family protein N-acetyltransferase